MSWELLISMAKPVDIGMHFYSLFLGENPEVRQMFTSPAVWHIYMYIYTYIHTYIHTYIYMVQSVQLCVSKCVFVRARTKEVFGIRIVTWKL